MYVSFAESSTDTSIDSNNVVRIERCKIFHGQYANLTLHAFFTFFLCKTQSYSSSRYTYTTHILSRCLPCNQASNNEVKVFTSVIKVYQFLVQYQIAPVLAPKYPSFRFLGKLYLQYLYLLFYLLYNILLFICLCISYCICIFHDCIALRPKWSFNFNPVKNNVRWFFCFTLLFNLQVTYTQ